MKVVSFLWTNDVADLVQELRCLPSLRRPAAYEAAPMLKELEEDGVWGACLQPSQGLFGCRIPDSEL